MKLKLKFKFVVAVYFVVAGTALAKEIVLAPKPDPEPRIVSNAFDLREILWKTQAGIAKISPPSDSVYNHVDGTVYALDWSGMPEELRKGLKPTMMYASDTLKYGLPAYGLRMVEEMGETVFCNAQGFEVYRLSPPAISFDSELWYRSVLGVESSLELSDWERWIFSPAHTSVSILVVPVSFYSDFLDAQEMQAQEEALLIASMMLSFPAEVTNLLISIGSTTNGTVKLEIRWPTNSFTDGLEIFASPNLVERGWELARTGITTAGVTNFVWEDTGSASLPQRFYVVGNADFDFDSDGLADAREIYLYNSQTNAIDTDADGFSDYEEVMASIPTDPSDDDISAPVITIASPVNNVLVVP